MSAPQIPNLLLGRGGSRGRGRGRGRGQPGSEHGATSSVMRADTAIQGTDTDAAVSRLSAVSSGYLEDPFAELFVEGEGTKRLPIINRGTYTRTTAFDRLISSFLRSPDEAQASTPTRENRDRPRKQIISLGAGTDTRIFRLRAQNRHHNLIYHEFDFPAVCEAKRRIVESNKFRSTSLDGELVDFPSTPITNEWGLASSSSSSHAHYYSHPLDLRDLPSTPDLSTFTGIQASLPTLIISECCLCYLSIEAAENVVRWFGDRLPHLGILLYEPIGADDPFGQMMVENLAARGIVMPTVQKYKTLEDQKMRLRELGFCGDVRGDGDGDVRGGVEAITVESVWEKWVDAEEKQRVDRLEGLDEVEEWVLLARHYAVAWGGRGDVRFEGMHAGS